MYAVQYRYLQGHARLYCIACRGELIEAWPRVRIWLFDSLSSRSDPPQRWARHDSARLGQIRLHRLAGLVAKHYCRRSALSLSDCQAIVKRPPVMLPLGNPISWPCSENQSWHHITCCGRPASPGSEGAVSYDDQAYGVMVSSTRHRTRRIAAILHRASRPLHNNWVAGTEFLTAWPIRRNSSFSNTPR